MQNVTFIPVIVLLGILGTYSINSLIIHGCCLFFNALFCCIQAKIKKKNKMGICILKKLNSKNGS